MKSRTQRSAKERVELQWRADRHDGFQKATLIYDVRGKLVAVDYEPIRTNPPATPQT
ncbi:MAG TPA: hypothetical protein VEK57_20140 [Thermoanaerobaculia bacterium]|nr:hypothetical protein [Thermoanaerobaculia bacterium]